jgi:hypothetical protein
MTAKEFRLVYLYPVGFEEDVRDFKMSFDEPNLDPAGIKYVQKRASPVHHRNQRLPQRQPQSLVSEIICPANPRAEFFKGPNRPAADGFFTKNSVHQKPARQPG